MKNQIEKIMLLGVLNSLFGCRDNNTATWSSGKIDEWFTKGEWRNGWIVNPDNSINKKALAAAWFKNRTRWKKAFDFLKNNDLSELEIRRYDIDGDKLFVNVSEYLTKSEQDAMFEAHRKYIDIQYIVRGSELIGIAPLVSSDTIVQEYNKTKDIEFLKMKEKKMLSATPENFFIFFPEDAHMPCLKTDSEKKVRKVVIKILID